MPIYSLPGIFGLNDIRKMLPGASRICHGRVCAAAVLRDLLLTGDFDQMLARSLCPPESATAAQRRRTIGAKVFLALPSL